MAALDLLHNPLHAAVVDKNVLQERRQRLVDQTFDERDLACKLRFAPTRRRRGGLKSEHRVGSQGGCDFTCQGRGNVVVENGLGVVDR